MRRGTSSRSHSWASVASAIAGAGFIFAATVPADAQQLDAVNQRFGNWELSCPPETGDSKPPCRLSQQLAIPENGQTVFALTILPGAKKNELVGIVSIPLGGYIAPGIELRIDGKKPYKLLVETCNASGCHAGFPISPALQKELSAGKQATFRIWTTKAKPTDIPVSLADGAKALAALKERSTR